MIQTMKKILVTFFCIFAIPIYASVARSIDSTYEVNYTHLLGIILYFVLTVYSIYYLKRKKCKYSSRDIIIAVLLGSVTIAYTIPLRFVGFAAGICTTCIFLVVRNMLLDDDFVWFKKDVRSNILLFGGITLTYLLIFLTKDNVTFQFHPLIVLKALAPGISEELIFRVFLMVFLFKKLDLDDTFGNKAWVFLIITIPFGFLHCIDLFMMNDVGGAMMRCYTTVVNSLFDVFLIYKFGFIYGVYAHALSDFLVMSMLLN